MACWTRLWAGELGPTRLITRGRGRGSHLTEALPQTVALGAASSGPASRDASLNRGGAHVVRRIQRSRRLRNLDTVGVVIVPVLWTPDADTGRLAIAGERCHSGDNGRQHSGADHEHQDPGGTDAARLRFMAVLVLLAAAARARLVSSGLGHRRHLARALYRSALPAASCRGSRRSASLYGTNRLRQRTGRW